MILHMGGGGAKELAIKVVGGTVQPTGVAGLIWVNTATTISKWTFAVTSPTSPALGDVWIQTDATNGNLVSLLKKTSTNVRINVSRILQYNGTAWLAKYGHYYVGSMWYQLSTAFNPQTDIAYTGTKQYIDDGNGHWRVKFLTSGTLTFLVDPGMLIDAFMVGGGSGGAGGTGTYHNFGGSGGGGGYTKTFLAISSIQTNTPYSIVIGAGGAGSAVNGGNNAGGSSSIFGNVCSGGASIDGGSGGGSKVFQAVGTYGGTNGGNGQSKEPAVHLAGIGQGSTTREFANASGALYAGGGGGGGAQAGNAGGAGGAGGGANGGADSVGGSSAVANTGGGGGGGGAYAGAGGNGGSGIVIIRNHR